MRGTGVDLEFGWSKGAGTIVVLGLSPYEIDMSAPQAPLLSIPPEVGRRIVEAGSVFQCPLLNRDKFVEACKKHGLDLGDARLERFERLGVFGPLFRLSPPAGNNKVFSLPIKPGGNWFDLGWARDTSGIGIPADLQGEGYYSLFQISHLEWLLSSFTMTTQLDSYIDPATGRLKALRSKGSALWLDQVLKTWRNDTFRRGIPLLCQFISERYYPGTQSDQRTIKYTAGGFYHYGLLSADQHGRDWRQYARQWEPQSAATLFSLSPEKLKHAYEALASQQEDTDPLAAWYQLVQFIKLELRQKLKGEALLAELVPSAPLMLRSLYKDLYNDDLPHPNEVMGTIFTHFPELDVRRDTRRYLEYVANRFGVNPQAKGMLFLEGETEVQAVSLIFEKWFGIHPGKLAVDIINMNGIDNMTGGKRGRFKALLRLIDFLHVRQTFCFVILDNENDANKFAAAARKEHSIFFPDRRITRSEYVKVWKSCFEFDNFSDTEIAHAMTQVGGGTVTFKRSEITQCRADKKNPAQALASLYRDRIGRDLNKPSLGVLLASNLLKSAGTGKIEQRPIVRFLSRMHRLVVRNPLPVRQEIWVLNQQSKFFGTRVGRAKAGAADRRNGKAAHLSFDRDV